MGERVCFWSSTGSVCKSVPKEAQARRTSGLLPNTLSSALHPDPPQIFTVVEPEKKHNQVIMVDFTY